MIVFIPPIVKNSPCKKISLSLYPESLHEKVNRKYYGHPAEGRTGSTSCGDSNLCVPNFIPPNDMIKKISEGLIRRSVSDKKQMKALSLAFAVKAIYLSSQINDASYSKIAAMFGISRTSAKERIETLKDMHLVLYNDKHLIFKTLREFDQGIKNINIQNYSCIDLYNLKEVEKFLRLQGVFIKQSQIDYAVNVKKDILNPSSIAKLRSARKKSKKLSHWDGDVDNGQSVNTVMKASGLGRNSAINILKWGEEKGLLTKTKRISKISIAVGVEDSFKLHQDRGRYFSYGGFVFRVLPSLLVFLL